jgi:hypothetical protein
LTAFEAAFAAAMQAVYFGGTGIVGLLVADVALEAAATFNQWLYVSLVIELPSTDTTALPGMPPHAESPTRANKTAPSAGMMRIALGTTRAL